MRTHARIAMLALLLVACTLRNDDRVDVRAPAKLRFALGLISDIGARASLVPRGGTALEALPLVRGDDGVSFSGFIAATPGEYTLELDFDGVVGGRTGRAFLGRLTSNAFTVTQGAAVTPVFSQPLDTIGRDGEGDGDDDGFGLLDELLWGSDPERADSDGDTIADGRDCHPTENARRFAIVDTGSIEDCDGDGVLRPDLPYRQGGEDCDDENEDVRPGLIDDCTDGVDTDCNAATCPPSDQRGPTVRIIEPSAGEVIGCHRRIRAEVTDDGTVGEVDVIRYDGEPPSFVERIAMQRRSGNEYVIAELNVSTRIWMEDGPELFAVRANDDIGNATTASVSVTFALDLPVAEISPAVVGNLSAPVELTVSASAPRGIASIVLMRTPIVSGPGGQRMFEVEVGRATASPARFTIDPAALADGDYAFYPVVVDTIGNRLDPDDDFSIESGANGALFAEPYYICVPDPGPSKVPVVQVVVGGGSGPAPAKMRDHFDEAVALAAARDPNAQLVEIRGWGLERDGTIRLDQTIGGDGKWWRYEFFNFTDNRHIQVTWYSAAAGITNPEVEVTEDSPFGFAYNPFADASALVDSDVAVAAYVQASGGRCPALTGVESDVIRYESDQPFSTADVLRIEVGMNTWKATATAPVTEIWACP